MKTQVQEECMCVWNTPRPDIWRCEKCRRYFKGKQRFTGVTTIIKANLPADYSRVDPVILECARLRGQFVDMYFCEWLVDDINVVSLKDVPDMLAPCFPRDGAKYGKDTAKRIERLIDWWIAKGWKATAVHRIVYDEVLAVAGETDFETADLILDLKNVADLQPNYELQLGGYLELDAPFSVDRRGGIIHVTKDSVDFVPYDAMRARHRWRTCFDWYQTKEAILA